MNTRGFLLSLALPSLLVPVLAAAQDDEAGGNAPADEAAVVAAPPVADDEAPAPATAESTPGDERPQAGDSEDAAGAAQPAAPAGDADAEEAAAAPGAPSTDVAEPAPDAPADAANAPAGDEAITVLDQTVPVAEEPPDETARGAASGAAGEPAAEPALEPGGEAAAGAPADAAAGSAIGPPRDPFENPELGERERLELAFDQFQEYRTAGLLPEAENAAKRAVEIAIGLGGPGSNDTAKALTNLGAVQYDTKNYEAAKQNFQSAIDIYKNNEDQLSERLINPLRGLGAAQLESGRPDEALETFNHAVHISHVNEGPHNLEQVPILEALAETHLRMGSLDDAKNAQDMIYALNLRHLEGDSMNLVPPLMRRAAWQRRTGYVLDERATYRRVIRIIEETRGEDDIALIEPLTKLAESYYYIDVNNPSAFQAAAVASGEIYFKRAMRIAEESPESSWQIQADTMLALADYYNFRSDQSRAARAYRDAWDFLSADPERLDMRKSELEQVHVLNEDPIPQYVGQANRTERQLSQKDIREGTVVASYDVSSRGRMSDLDIVELNPPVFNDMADEVVRELRDRIYRPRFIDGHAVDSEDQVLTHRFFYLQDDLEQRQAPTDADNG